LFKTLLLLLKFDLSALLSRPFVLYMSYKCDKLDMGTSAGADTDHAKVVKISQGQIV